jgi:hypothetical protein
MAASAGVVISLEALWSDSHSLCALGETPDSGFPDRMMSRFLHRHTHGGIIFGVVHRLEGQVFAWWLGAGLCMLLVRLQRWSGVPSKVSTTASLGGKVQRCLGAEYRSIGACCRRQAPFSVVVASTAEGSGKISALIAPEDGTVEECGDGFYSVRMWCTLRVC